MAKREGSKPRTMKQAKPDVTPPPESEDSPVPEHVPPTPPILELVPPMPSPPPGSTRRRLPETRRSINRVFSIPHRQPTGLMEEFQMYVAVGMYDDGTLGEIFIKADKSGNLLRGVFDLLGISISLGLQHGVPLEAFTSKMKGTRFDPSGFTGDKEFPRCSSPFDLLARWLEARFLPKTEE